MATIVGRSTRRRRTQTTRPSTEPSPEVTVMRGRDLCHKMVQYPRENPVDPASYRRRVPEWVCKDDTELFHAFCVAYDILGTSYRPTECLYWDESV